MKKLALAALTLAAAVPAFAKTDANAKGFNASFWAPDKQVVPANQDIAGVRLNFFYGENKNVSGVDIGTANSVTGDMNGAQLCLFLPCVYNYVGGKLNGAQLGIVNQYGTEVNGVSWGVVNYSRVEGKVTGADLGLVNWGSQTDITGLQWGLVNRAKNVKGAQLGFVNIADHLVGVQLGLWNQVNERGWGEFKPLPKVFPFINLGW